MGKYTPSNGVNGDVAWKPVCVKQWNSVFQLNKMLENMDDYFMLLFYASTEKGTSFDDLDSIKVVGGLTANFIAFLFYVTTCVCFNRCVSIHTKNVQLYIFM